VPVRCRSTSHVTRHTSHITRITSHVTRCRLQKLSGSRMPPRSFDTQSYTSAHSDNVRAVPLQSLHQSSRSITASLLLSPTAAAAAVAAKSLPFEEYSYFLSDYRPSRMQQQKRSQQHHNEKDEEQQQPVSLSPITANPSIIWRQAAYNTKVTHLNTSHVTRHTSHVTRHTSHVTRHTSHDTRHTSHYTRHTSHVTCQSQLCSRTPPCRNGAKFNWHSRRPRLPRRSTTRVRSLVSKIMTADFK
jgi:hypothetical protein